MHKLSDCLHYHCAETLSLKSLIHSCMGLSHAQMLMLGM